MFQSQKFDTVNAELQPVTIWYAVRLVTDMFKAAGKRLQDGFKCWRQPYWNHSSAKDPL